MSGVDIFLSYARQDRATARAIAECLKQEGFSVWWDASLHSGETFDEVIERNLKEARAVVVLWSPASVASRWVRAEATLADRRNKLVPAIIQACDRPIIFELTHTADLVGWSGDASDARWRLFVDDLNRVVQRDEHQQPAAKKSAGGEPAKGGNVEASFSATTSSRRMLRPGNNQVIFSDRLRRDVPVQSPPAAATLAASAPSAETEVHCLEVEPGDLPQDVIIVDSSGVKIGRSSPADVVLSHKSISREHCIIGLANDELFVTDLNSTNGTFIDDERVGRATILPVGSVVRIGQISLRHSIHTRAEAERLGQVAGAANRGGQDTGRLAATS